MFHESVPADRERWIGVWVWPSTSPEINPFTDHCLVMSYGDIIFEPSRAVTCKPGERLREWAAANVTYGLSFDPLDPRAKE